MIAGSYSRGVAMDCADYALHRGPWRSRDPSSEQSFFNSVMEVVFYPAFVRLSVCLSVGNCVKLQIGSS